MKDLGVSVIIVTYNAKKTLLRAIESVRKQSYNNIEFLVIDGASNDGTLDILKKEGIRYISEPDQGIYDAMNKGWKYAIHKWILFLGADDVLEPNAIEELISSVSNDTDIVYGNTYLRFMNGKLKKQFAKELKHMNKSLITCHQSIMMKREVIKELGGFDINYKILADYDLLLKAYLNGYKFSKTNSFISIFSINGTSEKNINKLILERHKIIVKNKSIDIPWIFTTYYFFKQNLAKLKHNTLNKYLS